MALEMERVLTPSLEMLDENGMPVQPDYGEESSFGGRVRRKLFESAETARGGLEGLQETFRGVQPEEGPLEFAKRQLIGTGKTLLAPFAPVQATVGTLVGAPVEHALASVLPEETARVGGVVAELAAPLGIARAIQAGKAISPGVAISELLGVPREVPMPPTERIQPLGREAAPTARPYRYTTMPEEGSQLPLRLPTEPPYRPTEAPVVREIPEIETQRLFQYGPWPEEAGAAATNPYADLAGQMELFTKGRAHTAKVARFREIAGRSPSSAELAQFKNLTTEEVSELATHKKEIADLQAQLADPASHVPPTRALAAATEATQHARAAEALGARHTAEDIREAIKDETTAAINNWYTGGRPGGTTLAGSVAGSLAGFEQDSDGNWVFDPGKALLGFGAGALALGAVQQGPQIAQAVRAASGWLSRAGNFARSVKAGMAIPTGGATDLNSLITRKLIIPHTAAEVEPGFAPIYGTGQKFFENRAFTGGTLSEALGDVLKGVSNGLTNVLHMGNVMGREFSPAELQRLGLNAVDIRQYGQIRQAIKMVPDMIERNLVQTGVDAVEAARVVAPLRAKAGHMPESRFGPYKIAVEDAQGNLVRFYNEESKVKFQALKDWVKKGLQPGESMRPYYRKDVPHTSFGNMDVHTMSVLSQVDDEVKAALQNSPEAQRISKMLQSAVGRVGGFPMHLFKQQHIPGFSGDTPRVLADYFRSVAQWTARREAMTAARPYIAALESAGKSQWSNYAEQYMRELTSPTGDAGPLREGLFLFYLAGKMSSALVNLSGYLTLGYPVVGRYSKNALYHWQRGLREAFKADASLPAELAGGLRVAKLEGLVSDPTTQELLGTASGRSATLRGVSDLAGALFGKAETGIRRASYIAGHNIATEELGLRGYDAHEFAKRIVREANLDYSKADRPELIRAGSKAALGTFRLFQYNVLSKFKDAIKRGEYGTLARHVGTLGAVAGLVGMPGAKTLIDVARDHGYDFPTWVREKFGRGGEVALRGPVYAAGALWGEPDKGIDLSGSAGLGDVVPTEVFSDPIEGVSKLLFGVLADPLSRGKRVMGLTSQGEWGRAGEAVLPEALRAISVAARAAQEGQFTTGYGEPIVPATPFDVAARAAGFQPSAVSRAYEREAAEKSLRFAATGQSEQYYRGIAKAIVARDPEAIQQILQEIQAYNRGAAPERRIEIGTQAARSAIVRHVQGMTRPQISELKSFPRKARKQYQMIQRVY